MGVSVHALEARPELPGCRTSAARVHMIDGLAGPALIDGLLRLAHQLRAPEPPVLFLTNDEMVREIATAWPSLQHHYRLSWSGTRDGVARLLLKSEHEGASRAAGCNFPRSVVLDSHAAVPGPAADLPFPVIAKPIRPLSTFKTAVLGNVDELRALADAHRTAFPIILQQFIAGGDERIHFCAVYLRNGRVVARFDGRKLRSRPMGHTTVAEPCLADDAFEATARFFAPTGIDGPASLELKRAPDGSLWVIEPTVGRTDFWIQVCISNGVNLPWIEYCDQTLRPAPSRPQRSEYIWINTERDPRALGVVLLDMLRGSLPRRRIVLPYLRRGDELLALRAAAGKARRNLRSRLTAGAERPAIHP